MYIEDDPVVTCTSRPPLHNGKLQIPINGFAFYTCEIELKDHTPYKTESWYLRHVRQNHPEIAIATSTQDNEPCLFSNKTCNRMIAMIVPKAFELQNMTTKGCALLNRSSLCSSSSFTIEIIEGEKSIIVHKAGGY